MSDADKHELPSSWASTTIGVVADINPAGATVSAPDDHLVTFLGMAAVEELSGRINVASQRPFGDVKKGFTRFRDGDVLFAKITPCMENGKVAVARDLAGGIGCGSTEFYVLRPASGIHPDYLRYFVVRSAFRQEARRNMQGAVGQQRVPVDFLREAELPLAPAAEQQRIVSKIDELFSRIEEGERALERVQKLVERYRQSVLKAAVTGELTRDWRAAQGSAVAGGGTPEATEKNKAKLGTSIETGEALLARILKARREAWEKAELDKMKAKGITPVNDKWKQKYHEPSPPDTTNLPELPEGWVWASLDSLAEVVGGITVDQKREGDALESVPYLRVANVQRGYLDLTEVKSIKAPTDRIEQLQLRSGDILFNEGGDLDKLGRGWIWECQVPLCIHQNHVFRARLFISRGRNKIISWYGNVLGRTLFMTMGKQTTNLASLSLSKLKSLPVPVMSGAEATETVNRAEDILSIVDKQLEELSAQMKVSGSLRQAVLRSAFSAKLVTQDLDDEPASFLLERIAAERRSTATAKPRRGHKRPLSPTPSPAGGEGVGERGPTMKQNQFSKTLRASMTDAERILWTRLRAHRLNGEKFRRQQPIGPYIVDFVHLGARLIVEADGGQHNESASDERRDAWLKQQGFRVMRFWNHQIMGETDTVLAAILSAVSAPTFPSPSAPLPHGERGGKRA